MTEPNSNQAVEAKCPECGAKTRADHVRMVLWEEERLVIVEGVPAQVCERCFEQYYDDTVAFKVDSLRGLRFPESLAERVVQVPVFAFASIQAGKGS